MLQPGLAQPRGQVDQAGGDDAAGGLEHAVGLEVGARRADADDAAGGDGDVGDLVTARGRVEHAAAAQQDPHASFPAMMDMTAMRTAIPKVTCGRITLCAPSATRESISTPRLMGPGCMTMASGRASASLSGVSP